MYWWRSRRIDGIAIADQDQHRDQRPDDLDQRCCARSRRRRVGAAAKAEHRVQQQQQHEDADRPRTASAGPLWKPAASRPIGVTCSWMPLRPGSGTPIPAVGTEWTGAAVDARLPAAGRRGRALPPAAAVAAVCGAACSQAACAAAGVSPAAARAIAHPISFIHHPGDMGWNGTTPARAPDWAAL